MAARTRTRVASETFGLSFSTRETVLGPTPACAATSLIVTIVPPDDLRTAVNGYGSVPMTVFPNDIPLFWNVNGSGSKTGRRVPPGVRRPDDQVSSSFTRRFGATAR